MTDSRNQSRHKYATLTHNGSKIAILQDDNRRRRKRLLFDGTPTKTFVLFTYLTTVVYVAFSIVNPRGLGSDTAWSSTITQAPRENGPRSHRWSTQLALSRATIDAPYSEPLVDDGRPAIVPAAATDRRYAAVMIQVGNSDLWDDMLMCVANVAAAVPDGFALDVYVSYPRDDQATTMLRPSSSMSSGINDGPAIDQYPKLEDRVRESLKGLSRIDQLHISRFDQKGADVSQFLKQVQSMIISASGRSESDYEVILKQHTKADDVWRQRNVESLCGTPEQVKSIWNQFEADPNLGIVAPLGTAFGPYTPTSHIFPHISQKYGWLDSNGSGPQDAFDETTIKNMRELQTIMHGRGSVPFENDHLTFVAGSAYWIRRQVLEQDELMKVWHHFYGKVAKEDSEILAMEHALDRLIPTWTVASGRGIALVPPAPRVVAFYDPKHTPKNEESFGGEEFKRRPLSVKEGGLGYYDLMNVDVRKKQADLARRAGVSGFVFHHYWVSGSRTRRENKEFLKVKEQLLKDGEPNIPFMLSWSNQPLWEKRDGESEVEKIGDDYGTVADWEEHFLYLLAFFHHPNYIRNHSGKPIFILHHAERIGSKLSVMIAVWKMLALNHELPGLEIISPVGNFIDTDGRPNKSVAEANLDGSFHFWPDMIDLGFGDDSQSSSSQNVQAEAIGASRQYWGAFTGFNMKHQRDAAPIKGTVEQFQLGLATSFREMTQPLFDTDLNLFFVTTWNQWNEQAILEPDETNKSAYLLSIQDKLKTIPVRAASTKPLFVYHAGPALTGVTGIQCDAVKRRGALLKDRIHYLGGSGGTECINGGSPLEFDVRDLSQCSSGSGDCEAKLNAFSALVEGLWSQKATPMVSESVANGPLNEFLSSIGEKWNVRVLLSYRRYHEWLLDLYTKLYPVESDRYKQWPLGVHSSLVIPSFPDFYRRMNPTNNNQTQETKPHWDLLDYIERFREGYDEVRVFNTHNVIAGGKGSNRDFFCQMLPEAPHACKSFSSDAVFNSPGDLTDTRSLYLIDRLAVGAFLRGWVHRSVSRDEVRNVVKKLLTQSKETISLECLSSTEAKAFLSYTETMEKKVVPNFYASDRGQPVLLSEFFGSLERNSFCSEDVDSFLDKAKWKSHFTSLQTPRFSSSKHSTPELHVVISHCDKPISWIWKQVLVDTSWKSMTILSKCGKTKKIADLPPDSHIVPLPNVGRNDHSYAYWIADIFEAGDDRKGQTKKKASQSLPHEYVKTMNPNDLVMFINEDEKPVEGSSETRRPWKEVLEEAQSQGFACGSHIELEGVKALNIASKKNIGLFQMNEYGRAHARFKSRYLTLEDFVSSLPVRLTVGNQALNARVMKNEGRRLKAVDKAANDDAAQGEMELFMPVCYGGHFVASVERIAEAPVANWGYIEQSLRRGKDIEEPHYMERIWSALLSPPLSGKEQMDLMNKDFSVIRRRSRYKGLVTIPKPKA